MEKAVRQIVQEITRSTRPITVLTGAGISAESGIPTFRGPEGYWTVGSEVYHPQEMATFATFTRMPDELWAWYLYRMGVCAAADPNDGHLALVRMEEHLGDRFTLITQNIDGLHLRAGSSLDRTCQIHGNIFFMRCSADCTTDVYPVPPEVRPKKAGEPLTDTDRKMLRCPLCGARSRPHVLLFDECYNDHHYHFSRSLHAARDSALLVVVATAGATNLPNLVAREVFRQGGAIIDINIEPNPFSRLAEQSRQGWFIRQPSSTALPELLDAMLSA
jgi:NAD-dependent deacetylase